MYIDVFGNGVTIPASDTNPPKYLVKVTDPLLGKSANGTRIAVHKSMYANHGPSQSKPGWGAVEGTGPPDDYYTVQLNQHSVREAAHGLMTIWPMLESMNGVIWMPHGNTLEATIKRLKNNETHFQKDGKGVWRYKKNA
jgi:hypothetical protein